VGLCCFYGLYFGAAYFMSRYLFPLSPFLALLSVGVLASVLRRIGHRWAQPTLTAIVVVVVVVGLNFRLYARGTNQMHFQVVDWVKANVHRDLWVGAVQSGTLGYFHDRTVNLDGKVNPAALRAEQEGRLLKYVIENDLAYLVDWAGIVDWRNAPTLRSHYIVRVRDEEKGLGVLERIAVLSENPGG
jgi:hypothetical protein